MNKKLLTTVHQSCAHSIMVIHKRVLCYNHQQHYGDFLVQEQYLNENLGIF